MGSDTQDDDREKADDSLEASNVAAVARIVRMRKHVVEALSTTFYSQACL